MIQDPKGGSNSLFGAGGSNSVLGTSGGADFMTKLTRYTAVVFVGLCVALTIATRPTGSGVFSTSPITAPTETATPTIESAPTEPTSKADTAAPKVETKVEPSTPKTETK